MVPDNYPTVQSLITIILYSLFSNGCGAEKSSQIDSVAVVNIEICDDQNTLYLDLRVRRVNQLKLILLQSSKRNFLAG